MKRILLTIVKTLAAILGVFALALGVWFTVPASTPPIVDAVGRPIPGSIATLEKLALGGVEAGHS